MNCIQPTQVPQTTLPSRSQSLSQDLELAIERSQLNLVYQPQIETLTGRMIGAEALIRWHHPIYGEISPTKFIPIAERSGSIHHLGRWILEHACAEAERWRNLYQSCPTLSINISPCQIEENNFLSIVTSIIEKTQFNPAKLVLELTKTHATQNFSGFISTIQQLQALGITFALSDYGLSNLGVLYDATHSLQELPIDVLKFDRNFVQRIQSEPAIEMQFYQTVNIAKRLKIPFMAEGVETLEQIEFLTWHGCRVLQGYWYSHPCDSIELQSWLHPR